MRFLASGCGLGLIPIAPGTFGSLPGAAVYFFLRHEPQVVFLKVVIAVALGSILIAHLAEKSFKQKDCQKIVIDEVAGQLVCYALLPFSVFNLVMGFILFRLFDVAKIFPAKWAQDKLAGGLGVVGDDLVAGAQGGLILYCLPNVLREVRHALSLL